MNNILCIYHGNCADGFSAAWAVWRKHPEASFHAGVYGQPAPDCTGKDVYLVDFSYKGNELQRIIDQAQSVTIIDHHKTAQAEIQPLLDAGKINGIFDMTKSGAVLTWEWFHPNKEVPQFLKHVQDRDLWKFEIEGSREISSYIFSFEYDFNNWDILEHNLGNRNGWQRCFQQGEAIERKHFKDIAELIEVVKRPMKIGGHNVQVLNLPYTMASDACHAQANEGQVFGASYYDTATSRVFSLRSIGDFDVSAIAKQYGGGGHKNAAGFGRPIGWEGDE